MRLLTTTAFLLATATGAWAETEITFQLWGSPQEGEVWTRVAEAFHAENPDITVKVEVADWDSYWEKLRVLVSGGTPAGRLRDGRAPLSRLAVSRARF